MAPLCRNLKHLIGRESSMSDVATFEGSSGHALRDAPAAAAPLTGLSISSTRRVADVEAAWRAFTAEGVESPGQIYDFIRLWIEAHEIPERDQLFVVAALNGRPVALLPLWRQRRFGGSFYGWFPGTHVGCGAPLVDRRRLASMSAGERVALWQAVGRSIKGADFVYLRAVPQWAAGLDDPFAGLGRAQEVELLHRAAFASWEEADAVQRSKSRRKHDRQQGEKLAALGEIVFEQMRPGDVVGPVIEEMFRQRARRFVAMGIKDPFAAPDIAAFYRESVVPGSGLDVRLHVLRLNGAIVAARYSIAFGDRLFCLISSMTDDGALQAGSPGKQSLLRMMQTIFDHDGFRVLDLGAGVNDEKRHWCNQHLPLDNRYLPLTGKGRLMLEVAGLWQTARRRIKTDKRLYPLARKLRGWLIRRGGDAPQASTED
jgi:CelD/BcsL family acetyltransferase involved in cellulose biosynthesis